MKNSIKIYLLLLSLQMAFTGLVKAQLTSLPRGGNKTASVSEQIGITNVIIHYSRPGVKKREGHIWGELIPVVLPNLDTGQKNPHPGVPAQMRIQPLNLQPMLKLKIMNCPPAGMDFLLRTIPASVHSSSQKIQHPGEISFITRKKMPCV